MHPTRIRGLKMKKLLIVLFAMVYTAAYAQTYTTLGIGTSPIGTLHVHSATQVSEGVNGISAIGPVVTGNYQTVFHMTNAQTFKTANDGFSIIQDNLDVTLRQFESANLKIKGYNQQGITINTIGNVGIGMDNPTERLHVNGTMNVTSRFQSGGANQTITIGRAYHPGLNHSSAYIGFNAARGAEDNGTWTLKTDSTKNGGVVIMATMDGDLLISNIKTQIPNDGPFLTGRRDRTSVQDNFILGNVNLKLSADGILYAKEVKVTLTDWPDYVFDNNYTLPSLEQTEEYIKDNGHLPGVPSAKEIEEQGLNLGEMNKILMQKVEELTLQVIELNKQIKELKGE